jgi:hypothetical protein
MQAPRTDRGLVAGCGAAAAPPCVAAPRRLHPAPLARAARLPGSLQAAAWRARHAARHGCELEAAGGAAPAAPSHAARRGVRGVGCCRRGAGRAGGAVQLPAGLPQGGTQPGPAAAARRCAGGAARGRRRHRPVLCAAPRLPAPGGQHQRQASATPPATPRKAPRTSPPFSPHAPPLPASHPLASTQCAPCGRGRDARRRCDPLRCPHAAAR